MSARTAQAIGLLAGAVASFGGVVGFGQVTPLFISKAPTMRYDWWPISTIKRSDDPARRKAKKTRNRGANARRVTYAQLFPAVAAREARANDRWLTYCIDHHKHPDDDAGCQAWQEIMAEEGVLS